MRLHRLVRVYTCQNATFLEITCHGSNEETPERRQRQAQTRGNIQRGPYMSAYVLLNLLNEQRNRDKMRGLQSIYRFFATSLINSIIQEYDC